MSNKNRGLFLFYLDGRERTIRLDELDLDYRQMAQKVIAGSDLATVCSAATQEATKHLEIDGSRKRWARRNRDDIAYCGCTEGEGWERYLQGVRAQLQADIEAEILEQAAELCEDTGDDDEADDATAPER